MNHNQAAHLKQDQINNNDNIEYLIKTNVNNVKDTQKSDTCDIKR